MAAVINLASVAVDATGKVITATISGGTGTGYAISNTVGLRPHLLSGKTFAVASASVSTTTLTVNLYSPMGSGETVKFTITTSSTLTDSGANTPTGQVDLAMTNNSTVAITTLDATAAGLELSGQYTGTTNQRSSNSIGNQIDLYPVEFVANCTEAAILCSGTGTTQVAVDGAASTNVATVETASFDIRPLTTAALAAGNHLFQINFSDFFSGVRLSGGTSAITSVATTKRFVVPTGTPVTGIPGTTPVQLWGSYIDLGSGQVNAGYIGTEANYSVVGTGSEVVGILSNGFSWSCSVDGAAEGPLLSDGDAATVNVYGYIPMAVGLTAATHTFKVTSLGQAFPMTLRWVRVINGTKLTSSAAITDTTVQVASTTYLAVNDWVRIDQYGQREWRKITGISGAGPYTITLNAALAKTHAAGVQFTSYHATAGTIGSYTSRDLSGKRMVGIGDSNTAGANDYGAGGTPDPSGTYYSFYDPRLSPMYLVTQALNMEFCNLGIQGQTSTQMAARAADIGTFGRGSYDYLGIWTGTNDINATSITPATYKTNVQTIITAGQANLRPGGKIILFPPGTPTGVTNGGGLNLATAAAQLAQLVIDNPTTCRLAPELLTNLLAGDLNGVHYHLSGQTKVRNNALPYIAPAVTTGMAAA